MADSITPSPELVTSLRNSAPHGIRDAGVTRELWLINHAYAAGANQELEACCEWIPKLTPWDADQLRASRRPKPPSLKEQALVALRDSPVDPVDETLQLSADAELIIRRALEALPE
jgi:hypothetical protein